MPKFFVNSEQINNNEIKIIGNDVNHIKNVLRLSINDKIKICDKDGHVNYNCRISNINNEYVMAKIIDKEKSNVEAKKQIHVFQGLPKGDKFFLYILASCSFPILLALLVYEIFWFLPSKQEYIWKKEYDEVIVKVRERFGLGPEFKEVLYSPKETYYSFIDFIKISNELGIKYFAEEIDGVILVSVRNMDGKELKLLEIENYYFFDSNFKPK